MIINISSIKYKFFETTSEIAFSKIIKYNITLSDKTVENVSKDLLSNSVLSVIVKVSMSEDCIKKSSVKNFLMVGLWTTSKNVW
jgi:hypothetical protein